MSHTNKLINETSPYLLQHAHNPVDWFPWGEQALNTAKELDKPILVSIGYSACHWCHVMERESFENEETARVMNERFINIKIDREERPDLDHIYMDAVQAISGSGGWPLNVFLTPEGKPFYGGTYFPPVRAYNRASWTEVLFSISKIFTEKREEVEEKATELTKFLETTGPSGIKQVLPILPQGEAVVSELEIQEIYQNLSRQADTTHGGFGNAPKFPQTFSINFLLVYYHVFKDEQALKQALLSLDKMMDGGIYDQLGGGFARYSTDAEWLVPHFEKMLYDNALLITSLSLAYKLTRSTRYKEVVYETIAFLQRELQHPDGGFYAALDADSDGVEGKFYVWSYEEVQELLGEDATLFCAYYDITEDGNWEHSNIPRVLTPFTQFAAEHNISEEELSDLVQRCKATLLKKRAERIRPGTDDKIILGWNALIIKALCEASAAFGEERFTQLAVNTFTFLEEKLKDDAPGAYYHTYKNGKAKYPAFLDDYAYLVSAAIYLQEVTSDVTYLQKARDITEYVLENFSDGDPLLFYTGVSQQDVIVRKKEMYDGAVPSANAVMCHNLTYLSIVFDKSEWKTRAIEMLLTISPLAAKYPTSFGYWSLLLSQQRQGLKEIAIVGKDFRNFRNEVLKAPIPFRVLQSAEVPSNEYPLLGNKEVTDNQTLVFRCQEYKCELPVGNIEEFLRTC